MSKNPRIRSFHLFIYVSYYRLSYLTMYIYLGCAVFWLLSKDFEGALLLLSYKPVSVAKTAGVDPTAFKSRGRDSDSPPPRRQGPWTPISRIGIFFSEKRLEYIVLASNIPKDFVSFVKSKTKEHVLYSELLHFLSFKVISWHWQTANRSCCTPAYNEHVLNIMLLGNLSMAVK